MDLFLLWCGAYVLGMALACLWAVGYWAYATAHAWVRWRRYARALADRESRRAFDHQQQWETCIRVRGYAPRQDSSHPPRNDSASYGVIKVIYLAARQRRMAFAFPAKPSGVVATPH